MSLLHRLRDVIEEKANAQLGRAENPEEALDLSYEKLLDNLQQARRAVADALTAEKRLELQADQLRQNQARLNDEARRAVEAGREDLARLALTRAQGLQAQIAGLERQIPQLKQQEQHMEEVAQRLQAKVETFQAQKETIKAQYSVAEAAARIGESVSGLSEEMADVNLIVERAQDKTAQMQARSAAVDQLLDSGALDAIGVPGGSDDIDRQHGGSAGDGSTLMPVDPMSRWTLVMTRSLIPTLKTWRVRYTGPSQTVPKSRLLSRSTATTGPVGRRNSKTPLQ